MLRELLVKDIQVKEVLRDRLKGRMTLTAKVAPTPPRDLPTLLDLHKAWCKTQREVRTIGAYLRFVQTFEALLGALPVIAITRDYVHAFRDHLADCGLSRDSVRNHIGGLSTLVRFGAREMLLVGGENPFDQVSLRGIAETPASEERRAYEVSELATLFGSALYTGGYRPQGQAAEASYWLPLLGPFVGARLEELAQLRVEDVQCINGVWALRIANLDENQHLKTTTSYRLVPVHDEVIRCGFLAHVEAMRKAGGHRVFPSLSNNNRYKRYGNAFGKWYGRYMDDVGLADPRLSYHSYRFSFKQRLVMSGVEGEVRDALTGHWCSKGDSGRRYLRSRDRQYPFPALVAAIRRLRYDELDLSHLFVANRSGTPTGGQ